MGVDQTDHDRLFKELITTFFFAFLELFMPEVAAYVDRSPPEFLDKEIFIDLNSGERKEVDLLAKVRFKGEGAFLVFHFESQAKPESNFGKRMFHYFADVHSKLDLPVYPVVIFSYDAPQRAEPDSYEVIFPDRTVLSFKFRVIQLNRLNWRDFIRQPNPVAAALMTKMKIAPEDRPRVKLECMQMIARLKLQPAKQHLITEFMENYLRLNREEMRVYTKMVAPAEPTEKDAHMLLDISDVMEFRLKDMYKEALQEIAICKSLSDLQAWIATRV
jgi:hypothetical protein